MLAYMLIVVAFCTLAPGNFTWPSGLRLSVEIKASDAILNIALFIIAGFLYQAARRRPGHAIAVGLGFGFACSLCIEVAQLFLPSRYPSPVDLTTNALGGALGAMLYSAFHDSVEDKAVHGLLLELPLMGSFYLLIPLLWLGGLTATQPSDVMVAPILGLIGAIILASVWKHRLRAVHSQYWVGFATAGWFLVGSIPALIKWPLPIAISTCVVGMVAFVLASQSWMQSRGRRFELFTLTRAIPVFGLYLLAPLCFEAAPFSSTFEAQWTGFEAQARILSSVEHLTAFSVLGYLVAESTGRWEMPTWVPAAFAAAIAIAAVWLLALAGHAPRSISIRSAMLLAVGGAVSGVSIYVHQLAALRTWIATRTLGYSGAGRLGYAMPRRDEREVCARS